MLPFFLMLCAGVVFIVYCCQLAKMVVLPASGVSFPISWTPPRFTGQATILTPSPGHSPFILSVVQFFTALLGFSYLAHAFILSNYLFTCKYVKMSFGPFVHLYILPKQIFAHWWHYFHSYHHEFFDYYIHFLFFPSNPSTLQHIHIHVWLNLQFWSDRIVSLCRGLNVHLGTHFGATGNKDTKRID